jgi:hypothetical protein
MKRIPHKRGFRGNDEMIAALGNIELLVDTSDMNPSYGSGARLSKFNQQMI